jgi:hypothetical protein
VNRIYVEALFLAFFAIGALVWLGRMVWLAARWIRRR